MRNALILLAVVALIILAAGAFNNGVAFNIDYVAGTASSVSLFWVSAVIAAVVFVAGLGAAWFALSGAAGGRRKLETELQSTYERLRQSEREAAEARAAAAAADAKAAPVIVPEATMVAPPEEATAAQAPEEATVVQAAEEPTLVEDLEEATVVETPEEPTVVETSEEPTAVETPEEQTLAAAPAEAPADAADESEIPSEDLAGDQTAITAAGEVPAKEDPAPDADTPDARP